MRIVLRPRKPPAAGPSPPVHSLKRSSTPGRRPPIASVLSGSDRRQGNAVSVPDLHVPRGLLSAPAPLAESGSLWTQPTGPRTPVKHREPKNNTL